MPGDDLTDHDPHETELRDALREQMTEIARLRRELEEMEKNKYWWKYLAGETPESPQSFDLEDGEYWKYFAGEFDAIE